jgi:hypothetical protein
MRDMREDTGIRKAPHVPTPALDKMNFRRKADRLAKSHL